MASLWSPSSTNIKEWKIPSPFIPYQQKYNEIQAQLEKLSGLDALLSGMDKTLTQKSQVGVIPLQCVRTSDPALIIRNPKSWHFRCALNLHDPLIITVYWPNNLDALYSGIDFLLVGGGRAEEQYLME